MSLADDLANKLAARVIAHVEKTGDEDIIKQMSQSLGDSSQTLQEAFITSVRVQRAAIRAVLVLIEPFEEIEEFRSRGADTIAEAAEPLDPRPCRQRLMSTVKRKDDKRNSGGKHARRRMRIDIDGEFRSRRRVPALKTAAAHHHKFANTAGETRFPVERKGDVRQRPERAQRHRLIRP